MSGSEQITVAAQVFEIDDLTAAVLVLQQSFLFKCFETLVRVLP